MITNQNTYVCSNIISSFHEHTILFTLSWYWMTTEVTRLG